MKSSPVKQNSINNICLFILLSQTKPEFKFKEQLKVIFSKSALNSHTHGFSGYLEFFSSFISDNGGKFCGMH